MGCIDGVIEPYYPKGKRGRPSMGIVKCGGGLLLEKPPSSRLLILLFLCYTGAYMNGGRVAS